MKKQKVTSQMKGNCNPPEKQLNDVDEGNIPQKVFTEDLQELKKKQTEMNNALEGIQSRITEV